MRPIVELMEQAENLGCYWEVRCESLTRPEYAATVALFSDPTTKFHAVQSQPAYALELAVKAAEAHIKRK